MHVIINFFKDEDEDDDEDDDDDDEDDEDEEEEEVKVIWAVILKYSIVSLNLYECTYWNYFWNWVQIFAFQMQYFLF